MIFFSASTPMPYYGIWTIRVRMNHGTVKEIAIGVIKIISLIVQKWKKKTYAVSSAAQEIKCKK
jgi:hypothetical protein